MKDSVQTGSKWLGATVVIIASGPSLHITDLEVIRAEQEAGRCKTIVLNSSLAKAMWATLLYAGDYNWWAHYQRMLKEGKWQPFPGEKWTTSEPAGRMFKIGYIHGRHDVGLSRRAGTIHFGGNSGYAAMGLAVAFGAKRIIFTGLDMQRTWGQSHHHGDHPKPLGNGASFSQWIRRFGQAAKDAHEAGIEVINATRETALKCFPRMSIEEALRTGKFAAVAHAVEDLDAKCLAQPSG